MKQILDQTDIVSQSKRLVWICA